MKNAKNLLKIAVVDDNSTMSSLLYGLLSNSFEVETFQNGIDALGKMQTGYMPDMIVADLNTPGLDGYSFLQQLKASSYFSTIPVVMLSAEESTDVKVKCLKAGAEDFIVKPFNPFELEARINLVLRHYGKKSLMQLTPSQLS